MTLPTMWVNGRLYDDSEDPTVSVRDHGLVVGDGVFEALKVTADGVFAIQRHLDRMDRSAAGMGLPAGPRPGARGASRRSSTGGSSPTG